MEKPPLLRGLEEITPDWLTDALRAGHVIAQARVTGFEREPLGEGEGFIGQLERLHLHYDVAEVDAPATLIAKLPTRVRKNRVMGELLGAYEREISFYQELAHQLTCKTPRVYYADMDLNPLAKHTAKILAWIDRRPVWFIYVTLFLTLVMITLSRRRYVLLMEDMAPAVVGNQIEGAPFERCRAALQELGAFQAAIWQSPQLDLHFWLVRQDISARTIGLMYRRSRAAFADRFLARFPELTPYLAWLDQHADALLREFHGSSPHTLLHMDFRLDNLVFEAGGEDRQITILDWQVVSRGPGVYDAAYFIGGNLAPEAEGEEALLVAYHAALVAGGVTDYPLELCLLDYRRALMLNLQRLASVEVMDLGDERGAVLIDTWVERLAARMTSVDLDKLL